MRRPLNNLIFIGGHPAVGKTELAKVVGAMFKNVTVVEMRNLLREEAAKEGLKAIQLDSRKQMQLMPAIQRKLYDLRQQSVVLLVGHYASPLKIQGARGRPETDYTQFVTYPYGIPANAYARLDADTATILERAQLRKQQEGIGEAFLRKGADSARMVNRRRLAEAMQARWLSRKTWLKIHSISTRPQDFADAQKTLFNLLRKNGGQPHAIWVSQMETPRKRPAKRPTTLRRAPAAARNAPKS